MKTKLRTLCNRLGGGNGLIFILYCLFLLLTQSLSSENFSFLYLAIAMVVGGGFIFLVCPGVKRVLSGLQIKDTTPRTAGPALKAFFFLVPLVVLTVNYIAFSPGGHSPDTLNQLAQATSNRYNDWHPVIHTLLAYKLPLLLTGGWLGSIVLFQVLEFSAILGYTFYFIYTHSSWKFTIFSMLFVVMNPLMGTFVMYPWKDVAFAMTALLLTVYALQILFSKGQWIRRTGNAVAFVIVLVLTTLLRHNAVLLTVPLTVAVLFYLSKKRALVICLAAVTLFCCVKFPLYHLLKVEQPDQRQVETLGLPMTVIGAVATQDPGALDEETKTFVYSIAAPEVWEQSYVLGSYNSVKWDARTNNDVIEDYGAVKILSMTARCFLRSPIAAIRGLIGLTEGLYSPSQPYESISIRYIDSTAEFPYSGSGLVWSYCNAFIQFVTNTFSWLFLCLGVMHLVLLASVLAKWSLKKAQNWKKLLFVLPVFAYNFGSGLLLTGVEDTPRFFSYTFFLMPVLLLLIYHERNMAE